MNIIRREPGNMGRLLPRLRSTCCLLSDARSSGRFALPSEGEERGSVFFLVLMSLLRAQHLLEKSIDASSQVLSAERRQSGTNQRGQIEVPLFERTQLRFGDRACG